MAAQRTKASDKQAVCKKIVSTLKKRYTDKPPKSKEAVLETILYAICLENSTDAKAELAFQKLHDDFHDLNEVRVSSIIELERVFVDVGDAEWRALRTKTVIHHVFESNYEFEFESIRRKTLDLASRQLARIKSLSSFVRLYTLQQTLGSHVVPVDDIVCNVAIFLGFAEPDSKPDAAADSLKSAVRKADAPLLCHLLRCLATDEKYVELLQSVRENVPEDGYPLEDAAQRLNDLFSGKLSKQFAKQATAREAAKAKITEANKKAAEANKKANKKAEKKSAKASATTTKTLAKKTPKAKAVAAKPATKTSAVKKAPAATKAAAKKTPAKKTPAKKAAVKKAAPKANKKSKK